jgi:hypothetical protein
MHASSRRVTDHQRHTAFAVAGALVLGAAVAIGALSTPARAPRRTSAIPRAAAGAPPRIADAPSTASTNPAQAAARHADPSSASQPTAREKQLIESRARQFLAAYLVYEVGPLNATARSQLFASGTRALADRLIAHPVDLPARDRPAAGKVRSLVLSPGGVGAPITVSATVQQAGWDSRLTLEFEHAHGRWLVSRVT